MKIKSLKAAVIKAGLATSALVLGTGAAFAQSVNLTAAPTTAIMPDGSSVPMWGYSCNGATGGVSCAALNPIGNDPTTPNTSKPGVWSPIVITVPYVSSGTSLTVNLTNALTFAPSSTTTNIVPTSLTIVGQIGGGLGQNSTHMPSPIHTQMGVTWSTVSNADNGQPGGNATFTPPSQPARVQSFATEVVVGAPQALTWTNLRPGTYLIESGTHPSVQGPMGLYGMLVVTAAPTSSTGTGGAITETNPGIAYPGVPYDAEVPLLFSEIDPVQNTAVARAVGSKGFVETAVVNLNSNIGSISVSSGGTGYVTAPAVSFSGGGGTGAAATAVIDTTATSPTYQQVIAINVTSGGSGYTTPPAVILTPTSGGTGAAATAYLGLNPNEISYCSGGAAACYPPAVNYTPLYYLINGIGFSRSNANASLFPVTPANLAPASGNGTVLVRLVNAGLRMHVPSIVGSLTNGLNGAGAPAVTSGFTLIAEDGFPVPPTLPRVQSDVFMAAGKTFDVAINGTPSGSTAPALPVFDRELSLSGDAIERDAGMLAYIGINAANVPAAISSSNPANAVVARNDAYPSLVAGQGFTVGDPSKGVIANDTNVSGVQLLTQASSGIVTLNPNGTFTYQPNSGSTATTDSFSYCANGTVSGGVCSSGVTATVSLSGATVEAQSAITCTGPISFASTMATYIAVKTPGVLATCTDAAGYPLTVDPTTIVPSGAVVVADANGGFTATTAGAGTPSFTFQAMNTQGVHSTPMTVNLTFPAGSGLSVTVLDGSNKTTKITDYRWIIEEDRTFYVDPKCVSNPPPAGCPSAASGIVPTFGVNFHTSYMPFVAQGCTGPLSCENGQTVQGMPTVCDVGNGLCRTTDASGKPLDSTTAQLTAVDPSQVNLDPTKRYYISVLPGDAANPFWNAYNGAPCPTPVDSSNNEVAGGTTCVGHGMGGAPIAAGQAAVSVLTQPSPYPPADLSVFVFEDDFPLNGEQDGGGGVDVLSPQEPGLGGFQIHLWDAMGGNGDFTGQMTYDMFNQPLTNSLDGTIDPLTGKNACPITQIGIANPGTNATIGPTGPSGDAGTTAGITGMIVTCPQYESDNVTLSPLAGQAVIRNLMPGRFGVIATPGADRIARGEEWLQTNTLDGQKAHDSFVRIGEPDYFQEFGPASFHVSIGFANPGIINARKPFVCNGSDAAGPSPGSSLNCTNTIRGKVSGQRLSRTPDERLYESGSHDTYSWTQCYVSFGDPDGEDFAFTKCDADGNFTLTGLPDGDWRITTFDQWNDQLVDGLSTPVRLGSATNGTCPGSQSNASTCDMGDIAATQWQTNLYTRTFVDDNRDGLSQAGETGIPFLNVAVRLRDGSLENLLLTDFTGVANFNETFPLFSWYTVETDVTRYKNTGTHVVYDVGGPADGTAACGNSGKAGGAGNPPCGNSTIGKFLANTAEIVSVPDGIHNTDGTNANLRVPGAIYCAGADCIGKSMDPAATGGGTVSSSDAPSVCASGAAQSSNGASGNAPITCTTQLSSGRIDPPWVGVEGWQGFPGQNNFLEFGKAPYYPGENGGIKGHVIYASTRPFDDPQLLVQTQWEPLVPHVTINLYQEGFAADGVTPTLTMIDHTQTSSWDDWAQGFHQDAHGNTVPNMNCPGQGAASGVLPDLFFFSLYKQPEYLDFYNSQHGGPAPTPLPDNSQFKCYDGMHNWNQLQPAPYDGMYQFPSVTSTDPATGRPTGTNCTICAANPDPAPTTGPDADPLRHGLPMLPPGKYVVEVVLPPGYELVKEEDKNILIGDNYIAPAAQQFGGLGNVFILPDQASLASQGYPGPGYNTYNSQNPTQSLGTVPSNNIVPGFVPEPTWPCVGEKRIVPDYISLYPQTQQVAPFAGALRSLCDRKEVTLDDQAGAIAKFYVFTSTHVASKFTGGITDDYTSEFDPFSPQFGEKFSPPDLPVSVKDWAGNETNRVYADHWGAYNGMTYSTWEVNPPNPTGYAPTMMVMCMNDPGPIPGPGGTMITDPLFTQGYSQFCYELPFMPGTTQYLDTPVVPTSAFAGAGYNNPDCAYPDATPAVAEVDGDGVGPWVAAAFESIQSVTLNTGGAGYGSTPNVTFTGGGGGSGAAATATISAIVSHIGVTSGGFGYSRTPSVTVAAPTNCTGTCTTATATATVSGRQVTGITINNPGAGYTSTPSVSITGGGGFGARATAQISGHVASVTLTASGSGYASAPTVGFTGGGATTAATATANVATTGGQLTITALGDQQVPNYAYSGPSANSAPYNTKTINRHYGFGSQCTSPTAGDATCNTASKVTIGGVNATIVSWSDTSITVDVPATGGANGIAACPIQQQAQYGGSTAWCGQLAITSGNGKQSIDSVSVTVGGKGPTHVAASASIQAAIDAAAPGDLLMIDPTCNVSSGTPTCQPASGVTLTGKTTSAHNELLLMWKPVRLQGVGAASSLVNANTQPAGKLDPWRRAVNCLFGLSMNGQPATSGNAYDSTGTYPCPYAERVSLSGGLATSTPAPGPNGNMWQYFTATSGSVSEPQVDRLPLEAVVGWDATQNGNLAEQLQEPSLMGALEGAAVTVLSKGLKFPAGQDPFGASAGAAGAFPTGTILLTSANGTGLSSTGALTVGDANSVCHTSSTNALNPYPSNFVCNPSSIDGLTLTDSSQGGGGIFVHGWGHYLQVANNRIMNNAGTLSGGINIGQGEFPPSYVAGSTTNAPPGSCLANAATNVQLPYCQNVNVNIHNNYVSLNSSTGDELFSASPAGAGGVSICTGADYYKFNYNWVCGNLSSGDGGGFGHIGFSYNGDIEHNTFIFNQSTNPTIPTNGGGLIVMGAPDADPTCGATVDTDCVPTPGSISPSDGVGPSLVINANLIMGNAAESGSGGGIAFQHVNGSEVVAFPTTPTEWYSPQVTNNIIVNNVAGWDGAGISLLDALNINIINNTIASNSTTATAGPLFNTIGAPLASNPVPAGTPPPCGNLLGSGPCTTSLPQVAGLVSLQNSAVLQANLPGTVRCPANHYSGGSSTNATCRTYSYPELYNNVFWQNSAYFVGVGALSAQFQQNVISLYNAFTNTMAASQSNTDSTVTTGGGTTITGGTGACIIGSGSPSYWDIGVRGDTGPANHGSGVTLAPQYSVLTDAGDYPAGQNLGASPYFQSQYCNGSRQPPEACSATGGCGWSVPAGISDATVPNPIFNLQPVATVDEGNNWVNMRWGPLSLTNPSVTALDNAGETNYGAGAPLGNYAPSASSPAIDYVPSTSPTYGPAPGTDFFGNQRKTDSHVDVGAVEYQGNVGSRPAVVYVTPSPVAFGNIVAGNSSAPMVLTVGNDGGAPATGLTVGALTAGSGFSRTTSCLATLNPGQTCTITVTFSPTTPATSGAAPVPYMGSLTVSATGITVDGAPVSLTGTGIAPTRAITVSPNPLAFGNWAAGTSSNPMVLSVTNTGNVGLVGGTFTFGGAGPQPYSQAGGSTCGPTLAVGANCTIRVVFAPASGTANNTALNRTLTIAYTGLTPSSVVNLTGTALSSRGSAGITPNPLVITLPSGFGNITGTGTVTLTNTAAAGGSSVAITNVSVSGGGFLSYFFSLVGGSDSCTGTNLAPGASCTVGVRFTNVFSPRGQTRTGSISFTDSAAGSPQSGVLQGFATP